MATTLRILVAADKFKGTADVTTVNAALARGLAAARPDAAIEVRGVADGGDGTLTVLRAHGFEAVPVDVTGPTMRPRRAVIGCRGDEVFIELAEICGLVHLPGGRLDGMRATTWGLGLAVRAALGRGPATGRTPHPPGKTEQGRPDVRSGAPRGPESITDGGTAGRRIRLAIGGSASTDGGLGLLAALGAVATDRDGQVVSPDAEGLLRVDRLDLTRLDHRLRGAEIVALTDVLNGLIGSQGAAHVYGPQKGLTPHQVEAVDAALGRWARLLRLDPATPGTGAAGGVGAGVLGGLGGRLMRGAPFVLDAIGLDDALRGADLVVTGEGAWDEQSRQGKAPAEVLRRAQAAGVPSALVAGRVEDREGLRRLGVRDVVSLTDLAGGSAEIAMRDPVRLLEAAGALLQKG